MIRIDLQSAAVFSAAVLASLVTAMTIRHLGGGDAFTDKLLKEALIAATPGSAFGPDGKNYVRLSYAASQSRIAQALERIGRIVG